MTDTNNERELYRGGGRDDSRRWNRAEQYGSQSTHAEEPPAGNRRGEPADARQSRDAGRLADTGQPPEIDRPPGTGQSPGTGQPSQSRRYGDRRRPEAGGQPESNPLTGMPPQGIRGQPTERRPEVGQLGGSRTEDSFRETTELQSPGGWQWSDDQQGRETRSREFLDTGEWTAQQQYDQPSGQRFEMPTQDDQQSRRSTPANQLDRAAGGEQDRQPAGSGESDSRRQQPRDPETGRFLSKDRAGDERG